MDKKKSSSFQNRFFLFTVLFLSPLVPLTGEGWTLYGTQQGLPDNRVTTIRAYPTLLLACTEKGLAYLDGTSPRFKKIETGEWNQGEKVFDALITRNGFLWVATPNGVGVTSFPFEKWVVHGTEEGLPHRIVRALACDEKNIYAGTDGGGVAFAPCNQGSRSIFRIISSGILSSGEMNSIDILKNPPVSSIALEKEGEGFFSTRGLGFFQFQLTRGEKLDIPQGEPSSWGEHCSVFPPFPLESWVNHSSPIDFPYPLSLFADRNRLFIQQNLKEIPIPPLPYSNSQDQDENSKLWFSFLRFEYHPGIQQPLRQELPNYDPVTESSFKEFDLITGGNPLWIGTKNHGVFKYHQKKWNHFTPENSRLPQGVVHSIDFDADHTYLATDGGLVQIGKTSEQLENLEKMGMGKNFLSVFPGGIQDNIISKIFMDTRLLIGSQLALYLLDNETHIENVQMISEGARDIVDNNTDAKDDGYFYRFDSSRKLPSNKIKDITVDGYGDYWVATSDGFLIRLRVWEKEKPDGTKEKKFLFKKFGFNELASSKLTSLYFKDPYLWIGTGDNGLVRMEILPPKNPPTDPEIPIEPTYQFDQFSMVDGLSSNEVVGIYPFKNNDNNGDFPMILHPNSQSGKVGPRWQSLNLLDISKVGRGVRFNCYYQENLGSHWFGTTSGAYKVPPGGDPIRYNKVTVREMFDNNVIKIGTSTQVNSGGEVIYMAVRNSNSQDQFSIVRDPETGKKTVIEGDQDGGGLLWFDGKVWDNFKIPGIHDFRWEGERLYIGTDKRLRVLKF